MIATPFTWGTRVLAAGALLLALFLGVGALLPTTWSAERTRIVEAPEATVASYLDSPEGWRAWTPWPDQGVLREGPERGAGATLSWDHLELGEGTFRIVAADPPGTVRYEVAVEGGALMTRGTVSLRGVAGGTEVRWREEGDFGWNPLMGYWVLLMGGVQGREMEGALDRLAEVAERGVLTREAPADSGSTGASGR